MISTCDQSGTGGDPRRGPRARRPAATLRAPAVLLCLVLASALPAGAQGPDPYAFCDDRFALTEDDGAPIGELCVVQPSRTDIGGLGVLDLDPDCELDELGECAAGNGYGYHVVGIPASMDASTRVALLISGAYGAPYSPIDQLHLGIPAGEIRYTETLRDAVRSGHLALQVAYRNPSSVNRDVCARTGMGTPGDDPDCHYAIRTTVLDGIQSCSPGRDCSEIPELYLDPGPGHPLDVANAYFTRLPLLVGHLIAEGTELTWPADLAWPWDWSRIRIASHSQGSGHAYLIATLREQVDRVCLLAGPRDYRRPLPPEPTGSYAPWFRSWDLLTETPKERFRALVSESDADGAIIASWGWIGFELGVHGMRVDDDDGGRDGHQEIISDAKHSVDRTLACFSEAPLPPTVPVLSGPGGPLLGAILLLSGLFFGVGRGAARSPR